MHFERYLLNRMSPAGTEVTELPKKCLPVKIQPVTKNYYNSKIMSCIQEKYSDVDATNEVSCRQLYYI